MLKEGALILRGIFKERNLILRGMLREGILS
jgi:hypothetical protein